MTHAVVTQIVHHGYLAVFVLMVLESACIPIPSEVVMLLGGALAGGAVVSGAHSSMNVVAVGLIGAVGNLVGAAISYEVGRQGGRPLVERYGRYVLLRRHDLDRAERFFARRGQLAVLVGRCLPVVRTFISVPAGVARMPRLRFLVLTLVGSVPWTMALALTGWAVAGSWNQISGAFTPISIVIGVLIIALIVRWYVVRRRQQATTG